MEEQAQRQPGPGVGLREGSRDSTNLVLALLNGILVCVATYQAFVMARATRATERSLALARDTAIRQLRAYVTVNAGAVQHVQHRNSRVVQIELCNSGQTPAHDLTYWLATRIRDLPLTQDLPAWDGPPRHHSNHVLSAGMPIIVRESVPATTDDEEAGLHAGTAAIYAFGEARYRDIYGEPRRTTFRFECSRVRQDTGELSAWNRMLDGVIVPSAEGNSAD